MRWMSDGRRPAMATMDVALEAVAVGTARLTLGRTKAAGTAWPAQGTTTQGRGDDAAR
jgi:hypothetical protein